MAEYHKYVFNEDERCFVGNFEEMYQQEKIKNFDSWHQDDSRQLNRSIALEILSAYNFKKIIDIGCGKGTLTHRLKKINNQIVAIDISPTVVEMARARFPDIKFKALDVNDVLGLEKYLDKCFDNGSADGVDLVFTAECLSYLSNWKDLLASISKRACFLMVCLYVPDEPIGFVKSWHELELAVERDFDVLEFVHIKKSKFVILFAKSKFYSE